MKYDQTRILYEDLEIRVLLKHERDLIFETYCGDSEWIKYPSLFNDPASMILKRVIFKLARDNWKLLGESTLIKREHEKLNT